ncbi:TatD DNase family protein [Novosphingobium sp. PhB165]|nr:TatD DNase family protein [Novosphingobium sp. PhB165]
MALIDFHCHLDLYPDPAATAQKADDEGVYVLSVTTTPTAFVGTAALARPGSRIRTALGLHPELAALRRHELVLFKELLPKVDYVGEVGLDGSKPHKSTLNIQAEVLHEILDLCAASGGRTISLHSRGASEMLLDMLEFEPRAGRFVLHWFSTGQMTIERASRLGCWFSVGSSMLLSKSGREAVSAMPRDRILPETDGPFAMHNGIVREPGDQGRVYQAVAELWGCGSAEVEATMTRNFRRLVEASQRNSQERLPSNT